jgi:hypothetical protein
MRQRTEANAVGKQKSGQRIPENFLRREARAVEAREANSNTVPEMGHALQFFNSYLQGVEQ